MSKLILVLAGTNCSSH